jgi:hypothetical protein
LRKKVHQDRIYESGGKIGSRRFCEDEDIEARRTGYVIAVGVVLDFCGLGRSF